MTDLMKQLATRKVERRRQLAALPVDKALRLLEEMASDETFGQRTLAFVPKYSERHSRLARQQFTPEFSRPFTPGTTVGYFHPMNASDLITVDPDILGGTPVFKGTRVPVKSLFEYLERDYTLEEFLDCFPSVTREMACQLLERSESALIAPESR